MATKKTTAKKKKSAPEPRYIKDGQDLYIHIDDLLGNLDNIWRLGIGLSPAIGVLREWRNKKVGA